MLSFSKYENFKNDEKTDEQLYKEEQEPTTNPNKQTNNLDNMGASPEFGETQDFKKENKMYGGGKKNSRKKRSSYNKNKTSKGLLLPKLRKIDNSKKKYKYKLSNPNILRKKAINEGIRSEVKKTNKTKKQAAVAKKGRFNILRIYRRNTNKNQCKIITQDMRYIDKKYGLNKTNSICGGKKKNKKRKTKKIYN